MTPDKPIPDKAATGAPAATISHAEAPVPTDGNPAIHADREVADTEFQTVDVELLYPDLEFSEPIDFPAHGSPEPHDAAAGNPYDAAPPPMAAGGGHNASALQPEEPFQPASAQPLLSNAHETPADAASPSFQDGDAAYGARDREAAAWTVDQDTGTGDGAWIPVATSAPRYAPFVFECSEGKFELSSDRARSMPPDEILPRWHTLITDFFTAPGPGTILVESASPKYAHVLAKRTLQRNGELTQGMELHALVRKAVAPGQFMLTYQLMPSQHLNRLRDQYARSARGFLLHDTVTFLLGMLQSQPRDTTTTLTLHLPRSLVLLCGRNGELLWARRYALSEDHGGDFHRGVEAVMNDMQQAARDGGFDLQRNIWIEGWSRRPLRPSTDSVDLELIPVTALQCGEEVWYTALPGLAKYASAKASLTPLSDRIAARMLPLEKWIWAASLLLAMVCGAAGWWGLGLAERMEERLQVLQAERAELKSKQAELSAANTFAEEDRKSIELGTVMAQTLNNARLAARPADVWNLIAGLRPQACTIQSLEITYEDKTATIGLEGAIGLGLNQARALYSEFLTSLSQSGFQLIHQEFQMDMDTNHFTVTLERHAEE